ncbi:MAG: amino acid permease [Pseudomonadota bacterium]
MSGNEHNGQPDRDESERECRVRTSLDELPDEEEETRGRFGTFGGVFTPSVLTILGVIMFMRTGFVVGESGLWLALVILGISKMITILTSFSISTIATNTDVKVGGVYFMISRVLGLNFGGSIGITLFLAQAVGVAFYVIGFTEALESIVAPLLKAYTFFDVDLWALWQTLHAAQVLSTLVVFGLFVLTFKGAGIAIKAQYIVLAILVISILSFIVGGFLSYDEAILEANKGSAFTKDMSFWAVFAIFFPAVTGITAGANMSGDLKNPSRAIPLGTIFAVAFTAAIYLLQIWLMAGSVGRKALIADPFGALQQMSLFGPLVILGVFTATLSSALGSFLGAPRILQSMARDRLLGFLNFFAKGHGVDNEPRRATVATFILAACIIWAGDLNAVAEVISMFFLIAYGMINLSAFVESVSANPSFRPGFKWSNKFTSITGTVGCVVAMIKINETAALIAMAVTGAIWMYLTRKNIKTEWGDAKRGYVFSKIRDNLLVLGDTPVHPKNWRPILTAVADNPTSELQLVTIAALIEGRRGLLSVADISAEPGMDQGERLEMRRARLGELKNFLAAQGIQAYGEAVVGSDYLETFSSFLQCYSLGPLRPNTGMIAIPPGADPGERAQLARQVHLMWAHGLNLAILKPGDFVKGKRRKRIIDVWWRGERNGSLMALFAYLMTLNRAWQGAMVRLLRIVGDDEDAGKESSLLKLMLKKARLSMAVDVIASCDPPREIMKRMSARADLVFVGMSESNALNFAAYLHDMHDVFKSLPTTVIVLSKGDANIFV